MEMIKLLAWDANKRGSLGYLLHNTAKNIMRKMIRKTAQKMQPVIKYKIEKGWYNPEVKILYDDMTEVINQNRYGEGHDVPATYDDAEGNKNMFLHLRDIICTTLDEDSYYLLRFFYLLDLTFEHRNRYALAHHKSMAYWNWEAIAEVLRAKRAEFEKLNPNTMPTNEDYNRLYDEARREVNDRKTCNDNKGERAA